MRPFTSFQSPLVFQIKPWQLLLRWLVGFVALLASTIVHQLLQQLSALSIRHL